MDIKQSARQAREASRKTAILTSEQKNRILEAMADALLQQEESIISANRRDLKRGVNLPAPLLKRLTFDHKKTGGLPQWHPFTDLPPGSRW